MSKLNAKLLFALSAACFVVPALLIELYQFFVPLPYEPGTYVANGTMQFLLNMANDWFYPIGVVLFLVGIAMWYRESK